MNKELQQVSRVTKDKFSFTWKIENFSSLLTNPGEFIRSAVVKSSGCHWCLKLYPNGQVFPNQIQVNLETVGCASLPSGIAYKIGFRDIFGDMRFEFSMTIPKYAENEYKFKFPVQKSNSEIQSSESNLESFQTKLNSDVASTDKAVTSSALKPSSLGPNTTSGFATVKSTTKSLFSDFLPMPETTAAQFSSGNSLSSASIAAADRKVDVSRLLSQSGVSGTEKDTNPAKNKTDSTRPFFGSISSSDTLLKADGIQSRPRFLKDTNPAENEYKFKFSVSSESTLEGFQTKLNSDATGTDKAVTSSALKPSSLDPNTTSGFATGKSTTKSLFSDFLPMPETTAAQFSSGNSFSSASIAAADRKVDVSRFLSQSAVSGTEEDTNPAKNKTTDSTTKAPCFCFLGEKEKFDPLNTSGSSSQSFLEAIQGAYASRKLLFEKKDEFLPDDVLTVVCEMKVTSVVDVSESSMVNEDASAVGIKLLAKNLEDAFDIPRFTDVTLKAGDAEFHAHKIILAIRSKVFDGMFYSGMKESQENVVNLVEMKPSTAESMLRYIYTGKIQELSMDRAIDLYVAADRYDMPELKQWCKEFILRHISPDSVCDVTIVANLHGDEDLEKATKRTIRNNLKTVLNSEKWLSLSKDSPALYLGMLQVALSDDSN